MFVRKELIHRYTRRKRDHDYYAPCQYHIILRKAENCPRFGRVVGDATLPRKHPEGARMEHTKLGKIICGNIYDFPKKYRACEVYQYCVMPDHVHLFFHVKEKNQYHLGLYIQALKNIIANEVSSKCGKAILPSIIFEDNYTDKIIYVGRNFQVIYDYIQDNPRRLGMRLQYPEFFERKQDLEIEGENYESYGSRHLLNNPFKMEVHVPHRASQSEFEEMKEKWLEHVAEGGVLISPFISPREKQVKETAMLMGGKIIRIEKDPFSEKYKPAETEFNYCSRGNLLIIAPKISFGDKSKVTFRKMNRVAAHLCEF